MQYVKDDYEFQQIREVVQINPVYQGWLWTTTNHGDSVCWIQSSMWHYESTQYIGEGHEFQQINVIAFVDLTAAHDKGFLQHMKLLITEVFWWN